MRRLLICWLCVITLFTNVICLSPLPEGWVERSGPHSLGEIYYVNTLGGYNQFKRPSETAEESLTKRNEERIENPLPPGWVEELDRLNMTRFVYESSTNYIALSTRPVYKGRNIVINLKINYNLPINVECTEDVRLSYVKAARDLVQEAENYFSLPDLSHKVKLHIRSVGCVLSKTVIKEVKEKEQLKQYCIWQKKLKDNAHEAHYFSLMLNGFDLKAKEIKTNVRDILVTSTIGGFCTYFENCAIIKFNPKTGSLALAHALANSLGIVVDDTQDTRCRNNSTFIMSSTYDTKRPPTKWSYCSKKQLITFMESIKSICI